jgi:hypothetical protein
VEEVEKEVDKKAKEYLDRLVVDADKTHPI